MSNEEQEVETQDITPWLESLKVGDKVGVVRAVLGAPDNVSEGVVTRRTKTQIFVDNGVEVKFSRKFGRAPHRDRFNVPERIVELTEEVRAEISQQRTHRVLRKRLENITKLLSSHVLSAAAMEGLYAAIVKWRTEHGVDC